MSSNVDEDFPNLGSVDLRGWEPHGDERFPAGSGFGGGSEERRDFYVVLFQKEFYFDNLDRPTTFDWSWCAGVRCAQVTPKTRRVVASDVHTKSWDVN